MNSVLFETAVCMTIYIGVMALEFAPALFERLGWKVSLKRLNKVMFFIIALARCCRRCTSPQWGH